MPSPARARRAAETDDFDPEDAYDDDFGRQLGQEKMKQLLLDLVGRWHWIILGLVLGVLGGMYYVSKSPKLYQSTATILVKQRTATVMSRDQVEEMDLGSAEALNTVAELIRRPGLMEKVASRANVRELPGLMPPPVEWLPDWAAEWLGRESPGEAPASVPAPSALAGHIGSWTSISIRRGTRLLDVTVRHTSPEVAMTLANAIAVEYQAERTGDRSEGRSTSSEILTAERDQARERLQVAQNALANYQRALTTLEELEQREDAVVELKRRYLPKHPKMTAGLADQQTYTERFMEEFESARSSLADRAYWESTAPELEAAGDDADKRLAAARRLLVARGTVLESEIQSQTNVFNNILTRIQESDINQQAVESDMEIRSTAQLPGSPVAPNPEKIITTGSLAGLGAGLLLALVFVRLDNKFHTVAQVERETGLPVLAAVSDIQPKHLEAAAKKRRINEDLIPAARKRWDKRLVFREGVSGTTFAEMFRVLRASVSLLGDERKRKITLFTSALPGEGKTLISCNFALAAAQQGKRTLLIDLDLRKPSVHKNFGLKRDSHPFGATEVLAGQARFEDAVCRDTGDEHLHLILSGKQAPNPGELLNADLLEELLRTAVGHYDLVVVDSAPLLAVPDTRIIAPRADNVCLVTRAEYVAKGAVRRALSLLASDQNTPAGLVFNGFVEKRRLIGLNYSYGNYQTNRYGKSYRYGYGGYRSYGAYGTEEA